MSAPRVQLFATCLGDLVLPEAVADADVSFLEAAGERHHRLGLGLEHRHDQADVVGRAHQRRVAAAG